MGTWSTPNTMPKARRLAKLLARPLPAEKATEILYYLVGDDRLFDDIGAEYATSDVRNIVARKLQEWDMSYHTHPDSWFDEFSPGVWSVLRRAYEKILRPARRS